MADHEPLAPSMWATITAVISGVSLGIALTSLAYTLANWFHR